MYVRMARFEGADPHVLERELESMAEAEMLVFVDSGKDARKIDEMFGQMSPSTEGGGKRQSADVYEVAIESR